MPVVDTPQEPSKLKTTLLAPVRWLVIGLSIVLFIIFVLLALAFFFIAKALNKLYRFAGGRSSEEFEQRAAALGEIIHTPQTTHDPDTNNAINLNVQVLRDNYGEPDTGDKFIKEIEDFINGLECIKNDTKPHPKRNQLTKNEKTHALACLKRIKSDTETHSICGLKLKQILNLVWKACNDKSKKSANSGIDIDARILQRKYQLVKHLIDAETEYGGAWHACFTGTFNHIVSSLYIFEEFPFKEKVDKNGMKLKFEHDLQKKGEELFNQLPSDEVKREVAEALSNPSPNFFSDYIKLFQDHPARAVLGDKECDGLVMTYLTNLQYTGAVAQFTR